MSPEDDQDASTAYRENPQAWVARQELEALLRFVQARDPSLFAWFAGEVRGSLRAALARAASVGGDEEVELIEWARRLRTLVPARLPRRLHRPRRDAREAYWIWVACYHWGITKALSRCWKRGRLATGINTLLANRLPGLFNDLKISHQRRPPDSRLEKWARALPLDRFADHVVAEIMGSSPLAIRRGLARQRAKWLFLPGKTLEALPWAMQRRLARSRGS